MNPKSLFSLNEHLDVLSQSGDPLETLATVVDFESFRALLMERLGLAFQKTWLKKAGSDAGKKVSRIWSRQVPWLPKSITKKGQSVIFPATSMVRLPTWMSAFV
ncbi:MAG: hypothetical protein OXE98_08665 [Hyphomicrobiales bacterium]|nr:hypothetical protein [Hyphomicrobiales bacterium]